MTVSLSSLAEVHYAVFHIPTTTTPREGDGLGLDENELERESLASGGDGGAGYVRRWGCGSDGGVVGGRTEPIALNGTAGLVASGVVPSTITSDSLTLAAVDKGAATIPAAVPPAAGVPTTPTPLGATGQSSLLAASRSIDSDALEVVFRVDGLLAAQAYSICLFTETPGSNGYVHIIVEVIPECLSRG